MSLGRGDCLKMQDGSKQHIPICSMTPTKIWTLDAQFIPMVNMLALHQTQGCTFMQTLYSNMCSSNASNEHRVMGHST